MSAPAAPPPVDHVEMLSRREFARRDGCDEKLVRRAIKTGALPDLSSKLLPASLVHTDWRPQNRRADRALPEAPEGADFSADSTADSADSADIPQSETADEDSVERAVAEVMSKAAPWSLAEAERRKENALAMLRELEFDQKSGLVVMAAEATRLVGEEYARVRNRLLAVPSGYAPQVHRCKTVAETQGLLTEIIHGVLSELSIDGAAVS